MEWAQTLTIIGALTAVMGLVVGLQTFWIARALDALRSEMHREVDVLRDEMHRGFDRLEGREPPSLRRA